MSQAKNGNTRRVRRAVLAGIATAPALAAPALALPIADPIFAAIERHKMSVQDLAGGSSVSGSGASRCRMGAGI